MTRNWLTTKYAISRPLPTACKSLGSGETARYNTVDDTGKDSSRKVVTRKHGIMSLRCSRCAENNLPEDDGNNKRVPSEWLQLSYPMDTDPGKMVLPV